MHNNVTLRYILSESFARYLAQSYGSVVMTTLRISSTHVDPTFLEAERACLGIFDSCVGRTIAIKQWFLISAQIRSVTMMRTVDQLDIDRLLTSLVKMSVSVWCNPILVARALGDLLPAPQA